MSCNMQADSYTQSVAIKGKRDKGIHNVKKINRESITGLTHECGVFGCIAAGDWPSQIDVAQVICLGKYKCKFTTV